MRTPEGTRVLTAPELRNRVKRMQRIDWPRLRRLWAYYRNSMRVAAATDRAGCDRPYHQAQEWGLPSRITGFLGASGEPFCAREPAGVARKEVVIENDIAWRIDTMVDYLFGKPVTIRSAAPDESRRAVIDRLVLAILAQNGGILFLQQLALLGTVYGFVDVLVKLEDEQCADSAAGDERALAQGGQRLDGACGAQDLGQPPAGGSSGVDEQPVAGSAPAAGGQASPPGARDEGGAAPAGSTSQQAHALLQQLARRVRLEIVEPARALPLLSSCDWRVIEGYAQVWEADATRGRACREDGQGGAAGVAGRWWERLLRSAGARWWPSDGQGENGVAASKGGPALHVEVITAGRWQRYEDEVLVAEGANSLGMVPVVHIQNTAVPFEYSGASEVEALIPLQDELNTRLSDRANRIALQSFKMYLGKGIENFGEMPVAPGRMWATDNEQAEVIEFGGDSATPSEEQHIADLREAMDKSSGVSPIAAGAIKNRIGRLTSAAALRITLIALLAKTEKKRTTYGAGLARMVELALAWLDKAGLFHTSEEERAVEVHWPSPLPENEVEKLQEAEIKLRLGVGREVVLRELGY
jgi:hypothetical protein